MSSIRVAMVAPPWLPVPPIGYGGIENVLIALIPELARQGVQVELFTTGDSTIKGIKKHWVYREGQYQHIHKPLYVSAPINIAHILHALNIIKTDGNFDIIHDHNGFFGPLAYAHSDTKIPPVIHTLHGPPFSTEDSDQSILPDNRPMWQQFKSTERFYLVGISKAMMKAAPKSLRQITLPVVHNAIPVSDFPFVAKKSNYFMTLARFSPDKGQHIAIRACKELGVRLKMAGGVGDLKTHRKVMLELANPLSQYRSTMDFRYYSDEIFPHLANDQIKHVGEVRGKEKLRFISHAKALLFPIQWDEPFGMAVIEALACGTPVIAMNRGAMPEIIDHGVNGFLANNEKEFKHYMTIIDEIKPEDCRASVERKFSASVMAENYIERYKMVIEKHQGNKNSGSL